MSRPIAGLSRPLITLLFGAALLCGCGQKGPLYLPQSPQPKEPVSSASAYKVEADTSATHKNLAGVSAS